MAKNMFNLLTGLLLCVCILSCSTKPSKKETVKINSSDKQELNGTAQGTTYRILYYGSRLTEKERIDSLLLDIDYSMSNWNSESAISKFNRGEDSVLIDRHFLRNLVSSKMFHRATNGAFNPLVKPIIDYYGLGATKGEVTSIDSLVVDSLLRLTQLDSIKILYGKKVFSIEEVLLSSTIPDTMRLLQSVSGIQLDFNAIAQGYSVDALAMFLIQNGATDYLIELGGEMVSRGTHPNGKPWTVGINRPDESSAKNDYQVSIELSDRGLATSGNYRKFKEIDGVKLHHTINPNTGYPAYNSLLSATVIASNSMAADALATSFMVMGLGESKAFLEKQRGELDAVLIYSDSTGEYQYYVTERLKDKVNWN